MKRSPRGWSQSPSSKLWLREPSRRTVLTGMTAGAAALLLGCGEDGGSSTSGDGGSAAPSDAAVEGGLDGSMIAADADQTLPPLACTTRNQQIVGPFPAADVQLNRSDIRSDPGDRNLVKPGVPLQIVIRVGVKGKGMMGCSPLQGAVVNGWQCDAAGLYASYESLGTASNQFLRGYQTTDGSGVVEFRTIYPGSYAGRCVHFHFSVRMNAVQIFPTDAFVGQLYFPDEITTEVLMQSGYSSANRVLNAQDGFYKPDMLGTVTRMGDGFLAELELAV